MPDSTSSKIKPKDQVRVIRYSSHLPGRRGMSPLVRLRLPKIPAQLRLLVLLEHTFQAVELVERRGALQLVEYRAVYPVGFVASALGCRVEVLDRAEEAGRQALVGQAVEESVDPAVHFRLRRRAAEEGLIVAAHAQAFAFGAGSKAVGDILRFDARVQCLHPAVYLRLARRALEDVLIHALDPARALAAMIGDVFRRPDEAGFELFVGQAALHGLDPVVQTAWIGRPPEVGLVGAGNELKIVIDP